MTDLVPVTFVEPDLDALTKAEGTVIVLVGEGDKLDRQGRRINTATRKAPERLFASDAWAKVEEGGGLSIDWPTGVAASRLFFGKLFRGGKRTARKIGPTAARTARAGAPVTICAPRGVGAEVAYGFVLAAYEFAAHKTGDPAGVPGPITVSVPDAAEAEAAFKAMQAVADGVFFTRDLTNEPANVLTTTEFAARLEALRDLGVEVEVLEEPALEKLGMRTLLGVGQGSRSPSKVVVMQWKGAKGDPVALVGKGVCFDTGGISLKPAGGMEEMTMDMGGAGVVAGVMKAVAGRKAKAHVVGLVGLVENMPDGNAQRPGDVVVSMKGDTVEVINTDAEGRLVLADVLWYAQDRFKPTAMVDLATLTGAIIVGLGHHRAGLFANDDPLANAILKAAEAEDEGAWRMPLGPEYDKALKSRVADMANVGGRQAGAITAAQFLQRFVNKDQAWAHIDIAGVASTKEATTYAPKGASGWGVRTLDRWIRDGYEG